MLSSSQLLCKVNAPSLDPGKEILLVSVYYSGAAFSTKVNSFYNIWHCKM